MSMLDKLKSLLHGHEDQAQQGVEKAGDALDERTGSKYESHVDTAKQKLDERLGQQPRTTSRRRPRSPQLVDLARTQRHAAVPRRDPWGDWPPLTSVFRVRLTCRRVRLWLWLSVE
ncbi:antitoxin [Streptomyces sp. NPDC055966]|uniref:antitoxin n=1 Tax=Streptomyces sp. NPDC055966 TaxID=3345669 RepID=UPI0035DA3E6C